MTGDTRAEILALGARWAEGGAQRRHRHGGQCGIGVANVQGWPCRSRVL
jgi:hypothetical protein